MVPIFIIGGLILLFFAHKSSVVGADGSGRAPGAGNTQMPDPGAGHAAMLGAVSAHLPPNTAITPYGGTSKLTPDGSLARLNLSNRIALQGVGRTQKTIRRPLNGLVKTSNPATAPFDAIGTRSFSGTVATTSTGGKGIKI